MRQLMLMIIVLFISVGLFLVINNIDLRELYRLIKEKEDKKKEEKKKGFKDYTLKEYNPLGKYIGNVERRIKKSNIRYYIAYTLWTHLGLCLITFILGTLWMSNYMDIYTSIMFGVGAFMLPFLFLQLFSDIMTYRIKRIAVDFLIIIKNFFMAGKSPDIFEAFRRTTQYISQPLKNYIDIMLYEYDHKINPIQCLENLKQKIEFSELKLYVENLQVCYIHGGDIIELTDAFIEEISDLNDDDDKEDTEDKILSLGLYILLFINFVVIYVLMNSSYKRVIFDSLWGKSAFALDILASMYIIYTTLDRLD